MKKTVLITGCSTGIGKATAQLFNDKGWNVVATMRNPGAEKDLKPSDSMLVTKLDVQDQTSIDKAIQEGIARFESIDVLVNNAGYGQYGLFEATPREKIRDQFDVNLFGLMDVTRALLPQMRKKKSGVIINISSGAGLFTLPMISLYCASKYALEGFTEALAYELASQNIIIKLVEPHGGVTATQFSERAARDKAVDPFLKDYDEFVNRTNEAFTQMGTARTISSEDVAKVIYEAATDNTDRLRYLVGNDTRGFIKAREEMFDQEYVDFMRARFKKK